MPRGVPEPWDEEMLARAAGMKRAGIPTATIAERLGVSIGSVRIRMYRMGAKRRLDGRSGTGKTGLGPYSSAIIQREKDYD